MSSLDSATAGRRAGRPAGSRSKPPEAALTMTVPEAGRLYFNLSRNASYEAAANGEIPTIRIGKLLRVPVRAMERMLDQAGLPRPK